MRVSTKIFYVLGSFLISMNAFAWVPEGEISYIKDIITYASDAPAVLIRLESGNYCYIANTEGENKKMYDLLRDMKNFGKRGMFHCHDSLDNPTGVPAHRIHRVIAQ